MVEVRYFAAIADAVGKDTERLDLPADATVGDLRHTLATTYGPGLAPMLKVCAFLVGDELTRDNTTRLTPCVDVLPPFAGG
ncbi:MoaD/ThiS family protein [Nocardia terpenica]|uniref:Molybdopterin synthase sulfur carrier subunit n=1 Tax=Nocardia terpenica TaxID=455432 RepID=A0A164J633_9NOCA|nr:MoaD/ThiS family protein [Nocardia terpenica]KZM70083.1 molybdopterin synthase sulfur carrier subunit [Nocardia terpenica]MBF6063967.1 MoaD/ThiS family protein [Nocardia terpenica]MBF6107797.1 MoaD/ThiS family protein [Nocardia terpenica]MBF6114865.1 MoaD/ThiS family protein [Nocardia terpenica]MBF6121148.1 MoaD/ThiS family protein [Nocardia terpenica]